MHSSGRKLSLRSQFSSGRKLSLRSQFSSGVLLLLLISSLGAGIISPHRPYEQDLDSRFLRPLSPGHLLGTDSLGRDIFSRLIHGARSALIVGLLSSAVALVIGGIVALASVYGPRWVDSLLMLAMDGLLAMPAILMAVAFVAVFGYGLVQVMVALGIVFSPLVARLLRAEIQKAEHQDFVEAERLFNSPRVNVFTQAILPQIFPPLLVQLTSLFAAAISIEAGLSFLGIGIQPPQASWGIMLNDARSYLLSAPWLVTPPGLALALTVYSLNTAGDIVNEKISLSIR